MISLVIPAYNVANCLECCIDSILRQTYSDFEIIIVDDGSTDDTRHICEEYKARDPRIRYAYQENAGVSAARNHGIDIAKGDWLAFVDADDSIDSQYLEYMMNAASQYKSDSVFCGFSVFGTTLRTDDTSALRECCHGEETGVITAEQAIEHTVCIDPSKIFYGYIWRNLFSTTLLSEYHIRFQCEIKISEDYQFILEYLLHATRVAIVAKPLYCYKINGLSVTTKYMPTMHRDMNTINAWILHNVIPSFPNSLKSFHACVANTYLSEVQNLCRRGTPYSLWRRIIIAYQIKRKFNYMESLCGAVKQHCRPKTCIAFWIFILYLDWIYILLFSIKEKDLKEVFHDSK